MQHLALISLLVPDYDDGIAFYVGRMGFDLLEDTDLGGGKRWVRVAPAGRKPRSCWPVRWAITRQMPSATRAADVSGCFCKPTTSPPTMRACWPCGVTFEDHRATSLMAPSPSCRMVSATVGT